MGFSEFWKGCSPWKPDPKKNSGWSSEITTDTDGKVFTVSDLESVEFNFAIDHTLRFQLRKLKEMLNDYYIKKETGKYIEDVDMSLLRYALKDFINDFDKDAHRLFEALPKPKQKAMVKLFNELENELERRKFLETHNPLEEVGSFIINKEKELSHKDDEDVKTNGALIKAE